MTSAADRPASTPSATYREHLAVAEEVLCAAADRVPDMPGWADVVRGQIVYVADVTSRDCYGYHASRRWIAGGASHGEIVLDAATLAMGADKVLLTLIHEGVHAYAAARDIADTSRQGRWHNARFAELATLAGLVVEPDARCGHYTPALSDAGRERNADLLARLDAAIRLRYVVAQRVARTKRDTSHVSLVCGCRDHKGKPTRVRVALGNWQPGALACSACGMELDLAGMTEPDPPGATEHPEEEPREIPEWVLQIAWVLASDVDLALAECSAADLHRAANHQRQQSESAARLASAYDYLAAHPHLIPAVLAAADG